MAGGIAGLILQRKHMKFSERLLGAIVGGPARDKVVKKIPDRPGCPGSHP